MKPRIIAVVLICGLLFVPAIAAGQGLAAEDRGDECIKADNSPASSWPIIRAQVTQPANSSDTIRIIYLADDIPDSFFVDLPSDTNLTRKHGFKLDRGEYRYNGADRPFIEYRLETDDGYRRSANAINWTFAPVPSHYNAEVLFDASPVGVVGDQFLLIGNYSQYTTSVGCHQISLIVSDSSRLDSEPHDVMETLQYAAKNLDVGHKYEHVRIFAIPGRPDPSVGGRTSANEAWISTLPVDYPSISSIAVHEYVHTRQAFDAAGISGMLWFTEATASYYELKFSYESGAISGRYYNDRLRNGSELAVRLGDWSTWTSSRVPYRRGFAYVAILDQKLTESTDGDYTLDDLVRGINNKQMNPVDVRREPFLERVQNNSNADVTNWANQSIDSDRPFAYSAATVSEKTNDDTAPALFDRRVREDPFGSMSLAFAIGLALGVVFIDWLLNRSDSNEEDRRN